MIQLIGLILVIVITKLIWDIVKEKEGKPVIRPRKQTNGKVIEVGDAWVNKDRLPYKMQNHLVTGKELGLYQLIFEVLRGSKYSAFPKVRLGDILTVPMTASNAEDFINRIKDKNVDLVVFENPDLIPKIIINIDTNNDDKRRSYADSFTRKAIETAGLYYFTLNINSPQDLEKIKKDLTEMGLEF